MSAVLHTRLDFELADRRDAPPLRADIALFVGLARRTRTPVPAALRAWWTGARQWHLDTLPRVSPAARHDVDALLNLPVPIEGFDEFAALFDTRRPVAGAAGLQVDTLLAAALRAFFDNGGERCYVLRCGDPLPYGLPSAPALFDDDAAPERVSALPGLARGDTSVDGAWERWSGLQWAYGLDDASVVCLPDAVDAWAEPAARAQLVTVGTPEERFAECGGSATTDATLEQKLKLLAAPSLSVGGGLARWRAAIAHALALLHGRSAAFNRRDLMLVATLPLLQDAASQRLGLDPQPDQGARAAEQLAAVFAQLDADDADATDLRHAQLQLVWPWLRSTRSRNAAQGLEPPEGAFAGTLARNALARGSFRSLVGLAARDVLDTWPRLDDGFARATLERPGLTRPPRHDELLNLCLPESGPRDGAAFRWMSDRTSAEGRALGIAPVRRLVAQLVREARRVGADFAHEPNGEATWFRVRVALEAMGRRLWRAGALDGNTLDAAFGVRCDHRTMTQDDLDAGRMVVEISFQPALPIERITVRLALVDGVASTLAEAA